MIINLIRKKFRKLYLRVKYNKLLKQCQINLPKYTINDDDSIDVHGDVRLGGSTSIPIKFNKVFGSFDISFNYNIKELTNCPDWVENDFSVYNTYGITNHKGTPRYVGGDYNADCSTLSNLDYLPDFIGGRCNLSENRLKIIDRPINAVGNIILYGNYSLMKITNSSYIKYLNYHDSILSYFMAWLSYLINNTNRVDKIEMSEIIDRLNEFDVIDDNFVVDTINLENIFYFYKIDATFNEDKTGVILKRDVLYSRSDNNQTSLEFVIPEVVTVPFYTQMHQYKFR